MPKRRLTIHSDPQGAPPATAPKDAITIEFARRLQAEMIRCGFNQSDLARQATLHMPEGKPINRDTISLYINAKNLPGPERLTAIAKALGVEKQDLLPSRGITAKANITPPVDVREIGDGRVWLRVNQAVDWPVALKILEMLKGKPDA